MVPGSYSIHLTRLNSIRWFNSLRPSNAIWRHRSGSTLAQVMACCLTAPSHYLNPMLTYHLPGVNELNPGTSICIFTHRDPDQWLPSRTHPHPISAHWLPLSTGMQLLTGQHAIAPVSILTTLFYLTNPHTLQHLTVLIGMSSIAIGHVKSK